MTPASASPPPPAATVAAPTSLTEARDALADASAAGQPVVFRGGGTKQRWGGEPADAARVIETAGLDAVVEHQRTDLVATVQAGLPLARLQAVLAEAGQWLAVDPPLGDDARATVGGVVATGDHGPLRLAYGPVRDLVIGVTVVLADGTVARSGGKVIKNVAGYDLGRLFCGSLGTLGLIAEVTVRLHPRPETQRTLVARVDAAQARQLTADVCDSAVEPSALHWADAQLSLRLEGRGAGVARRLDAVEELLRRRGVEPEEVAPDGEHWHGLREALAGDADEAVLRVATLPDRLPAVAELVRRAGDEAGVATRLASDTALGLHTVTLRSPDGANPRTAAAVAAIRKGLAELGGHASLRSTPPGLSAHLDPVGIPEAQARLMRRVAEQLDPAGLCAPGRLPGVA